MGARWGVRWGAWWALQWSLDGTLSLGVHVDPLTRRSDRGPYGPYVDLHLGPLIASIGNHPARASDLPRRFGQGAVMSPELR